MRIKLKANLAILYPEGFGEGSQVMLNLHIMWTKEYIQLSLTVDKQWQWKV